MQETRECDVRRLGQREPWKPVEQGKKTRYTDRTNQTWRDKKKSQMSKSQRGLVTVFYRKRETLSPKWPDATEQSVEAAAPVLGVVNPAAHWTHWIPAPLLYMPRGKEKQEAKNKVQKKEKKWNKMDKKWRKKKNTYVCSFGTERAPWIRTRRRDHAPRTWAYRLLHDGEERCLAEHRAKARDGCNNHILVDLRHGARGHSPRIWA